MADWYVRSTDGDDFAHDGTSWAQALATIAAAFANAISGDRIFVSHVHAETQGTAMNLLAPASNPPVVVLCVNDGASPPTTLATTATVTTTGASSIAFNGMAYWYGIAFTAGSGASAANITFTSTSKQWSRFENCSLRLGATTASNRITFGNASTTSDDQLIELINTTLGFGATGQGVVLRCPLHWSFTTSALVNTVPTTLFLSPASGGAFGYLCANGVDLSAAGSGKNLVDVGQANFCEYDLHNCTLDSALSITTGSNVGQGGTKVRIFNNDRLFRHCYQGTQDTEATIKKGGSSNSIKLVTTANSQFYSPLTSEVIAVRNAVTGSPVTVTVDVVTDGVTLTDKDAWLSVESLSTAASVLSSTGNDAGGILGSGTNQPVSSATWTTTGLSSPVKQQLAVTVTPQVSGPLYVRVNLARPSTTLYANPQTQDVAGNAYVMAQLGVVNEPVLPAAASVEDGVLYGAGSTEFEGELVAGGGAVPLRGRPALAH